MNGWDFVKQENDEGIVYLERIDTGSDKFFAQTGHTLKSQTFYPEGIKAKGIGRDQIYIDMPGFAENRSIEKNVCAGYLRQMAIQSAATVSGVVICLPWDNKDTRALSFMHLIDTIDEIFKDFSQIAPSLFISITKANKRLDMPKVIKRFESIGTKLKEELKEIESGIEAIVSGANVSSDSENSDIDAREVVTFLGRVVQQGDKIEAYRALEKSLSFVEQIIACAHDNRVHILRPNDSGLSRDAMLDNLSAYLEKKQIIAKDQFCMAKAKTDPVCSQFNDMLDEAVGSSNTLMQKKELTERVLEDARTDLQSTQNTSTEINTCIEILKKSKNRKIALQVVTDNLMKEISEIPGKVDKKESDISKLRRCIRRLKKNIKENDVNEYVDHITLTKIFDKNPTLVVSSCLAISTLVMAGLSFANSSNRGKKASELAGGLAKYTLTNGRAVLTGLSNAKDLMEGLAEQHTFTYDNYDLYACRFKASATSSEGWFYGEKNDQNGYQITFVPNPLFAVESSVNITKEKRCKFAHQLLTWNEDLQLKNERMKTLKSELATLRTRLMECEQDKQSAKDEIKAMDAGDSENTSNIEDLLDRTLRQQTNNQAEISRLNDLICNAQANIQSTDEQLEARQDLYHFITMLDEIAYFESGLIRSFLDGFAKFIDEKERALQNALQPEAIAGQHSMSPGF